LLPGEPALNGAPESQRLLPNREITLSCYFNRVNCAFSPRCIVIAVAAEQSCKNIDRNERLIAYNPAAEQGRG
jgi:hypothetical protein